MNRSSKPRADILVVDVEHARLRSMEKWLAGEGYSVRLASDAKAADVAVQAVKPDLILLDAAMPELDAAAFCSRLQADPETCGIPVILTNDPGHPLEKEKIFSAGAADILMRPLEAVEVLACTANHLALRSLTLELESKNSRLEREIKNRKMIEENLRLLATLDPLTDVFNRRHFFTLAEAELVRSKRYHHPMSVALLDIDHFSDVNDSYGHTMGDQILIGLCEVCLKSLRAVDIFARYGGEEFVMLLPESDAASGARAAERLRETIAGSPLVVEEFAVSITASLGVAQRDPLMDVSIDGLIARADEALRQAKASGRNRVCSSSDLE